MILGENIPPFPCLLSRVERKILIYPFSYIIYLLFYSAISAGKIEVGVTYGNPDLTPVNPNGFEGMVLDLQWDEGGQAEIISQLRRNTEFSRFEDSNSKFNFF